jgi:hypothetical protein
MTGGVHSSRSDERGGLGARLRDAWEGAHSYLEVQC